MAADLPVGAAGIAGKGRRPAGSGTGSFRNDGVSRSVMRTGDTALVPLIARFRAMPASAPTAGAFYLASGGFRMPRPATEPGVCGRPTSHRPGWASHDDQGRRAGRTAALSGRPHPLAAAGSFTILCPPDLIHP